VMARPETAISRRRAIDAIIHPAALMVDWLLSTYASSVAQAESCRGGPR
jgi:hypothetical protein